MTLIQCPLAAAASTFGTEPAILDGDVCLDYKQLDRIAQSVGDRFAAGLGERVGIQAGNSWRHVAFLWALFRVQATACLFSPRWPNPAVEASRHDLSTSRFVDANDLEAIVREPSRINDGADCHVEDRSLATILFTQAVPLSRRRSPTICTLTSLAHPVQISTCRSASGIVGYWRYHFTMSQD